MPKFVMIRQLLDDPPLIAITQGDSIFIGSTPAEWAPTLCGE
jgi:hypothetical protein